MRKKSILLFIFFIVVATSSYSQVKGAAFKKMPSEILIGYTLCFSHFDYTGKYNKLPQTVRDQNQREYNGYCYKFNTDGTYVIERNINNINQFVKKGSYSLDKAETTLNMDTQQGKIIFCGPTEIQVQFGDMPITVWVPKP
jgi:hypothetical protein